MEKTATMKLETFIDEKGVPVEYVSVTIEVGGQSFRMYPKQEDKRLFSYLAKEELKKIK